MLEAKQHPNADRLRVCKVDTGKGMVEVVCGAPNARSGMIGVFAPVGSYIPGTKITLDARPVRGVVSAGMLVSERELELSDNHEGIIELDAKLGDKLGQRYADVLGLGDPVIDVKLTPNRPDCTGVRGIARDLAAAGLGKLKPEKKITGVEGDYDCPIDIRLEFPKEAADACPCFAGRYIRGVSNGAAPAWMQQRLKAVGLRPINALVDVTNYISMDRGRPLHVYDADKLKGAIRARLGRQGEKFAGLDGKTYEVDDTMCVIADDRAVLGFGGILGGEDTGVTTETKNILIECAYFDPLRTAATGRKSGVQSDARYRFERGVDPAFIKPGLDLATAMMLEVAGGTPSKARIAGAPPEPKTVIAFSFGLVEKLGGIALPEKEMRGTLEALGFIIDGKGGSVKVTAPSWRPDIHGAADLVEEIVRIAGLDKVPSAPMPRTSGVARPVLTETQQRVRRARRVLAGRGLVEAITWSFIPHAVSELFGGGQAALELANPISTEMTSMRPSLLPGLLAAVQRNRNRGAADVGLFEVGQAYRGDGPNGPVHRRLWRACWRCGAGRIGPALDRRRARSRTVRCQGRCLRGAGRSGLRRRQGAGDARCAGLVPSRPLGSTQARPQDHAGAFRRGPPRDACPDGRCRPRRRLRGVRRGLAAGKAQDAGKTWAGGCRPAACAPRLRLRAGRAGTGRRCGAGRDGGRQEADRRHRRVRPVRGQEPGRGQEVASAGGDTAAAREDSHRRGNRGGGGAHHR